MVVVDNHEVLSEEEKRLKADRERKKYWKKWGSYVAERQWATGELSKPPIDCYIDQLLTLPQSEKITRKLSLVLWIV
jgi:hypothetical protein